MRRARGEAEPPVDFGDRRRARGYSADRHPSGASVSGPTIPSGWAGRSHAQMHPFRSRSHCPEGNTPPGKPAVEAAVVMIVADLIAAKRSLCPHADACRVTSGACAEGPTSVVGHRTRRQHARPYSSRSMNAGQRYGSTSRVESSGDRSSTSVDRITVGSTPR